MSNSLLTTQQITREALRVLHNKLTLISNMNRSYDDSYGKEGAKIGDTLKIRLPNRYTLRRGKTLAAQDTAENSVSLQVNNQAGVDMNFSTAELTLSLDDFSKRIIEPAMAVVAAGMESDAATMYADVYNFIGTPGTVPNTLKTYLDGRAKLNNALTPMDDNRTAHLSPNANSSIVDALKGLFQDQSAIKQQYREGKMGRTAGFDWYENPLIPTHTNGDIGAASSMTVNGASQTGTTLNVGGVTNGQIIKKGTVIEIAGVYRVHPETKAVTQTLHQFVVAADVTFGGTTGAITISPGINSAATAMQNVNASPANSAAISVKSGAANTGYEQQLLFHRDAFAFATADLVMPRGVDMAHREVFDGISMRIVRQYDINNDALPCRVDVLYGYKTIRAEMACRVTA